MTLISLQGHLSYFCMKISTAYLLQSLVESLGDLTKYDVSYDLFEG